MKETKVKIKASEDKHIRMRPYTSIYALDYVRSRAEYEAKRKNWEIENLGEGFYSVGDKEGEIKVYDDSRYEIKACNCEFFLKYQAGTCLHLEALELSYALSRVGRSTKLVWVKYGKNIQLVKTNGKNDSVIDSLEDVGDDYVVLPGVREYLFRVNNARSFEKSDFNDGGIFSKYGIDLRDYQIDSVREMLSKGRSILTLNMGLGKTICALACCHLLGLDKVLIVCPNTLKFQWAREIERFGLGSYFILNKGFDFSRVGEERFLIVNYELLNRNHDFLAGKYFDIAIIDEIQKIKNDESKTWDTINKMDSEYFFALSGTPIQNNVSDLVSVVKIIDESKFTPEWKFYEKYCVLSRTRILGWNQNKLKELRSDIESCMINPKIDMSKFPLPTKNENTHEVGLDSVQGKVHDDFFFMAKTLLAKSMNYPLTFGEKARLNAYLLKARRAVTDGRLVGGEKPSNRLLTAVDIIGDLVGKKEKVVVYSEWIDVLRLLGEDLNRRGIKFVEFHGEIRNKTRSDNLLKFVYDDSIDVFLSTDSGGLGVDGLQLASNNVVHIEKLWNPMKLEQRNGRLVRILQKKDSVNIHYFYTPAGVEELLLTGNNRKLGIIKEVMG